MGVARSRTRQLHALMPARGPQMHHRVRYFGMKLQREGAPAADRLHFENIALGKKLGAVRQVEPFAMLLVDVFRPGRHHREPARGRPHRVIADLDMAIWMTKHPTAEMFCA